MATPRHLPNAPITEAVIDIQIDAGRPVTFAQLQEAFANVGLGYNQQGVVMAGRFGLLMPTVPEVTAQSTATAEPIGLRLQSHDGHYIALVRVNGFTLSRQPPYEDWGKLEAETRRLWTAYVSIWRPVKVVRVATRFINNLKLPVAPGQDFSDWIDTLVELPREVPQLIGGFLQQFQIHDAPTSASANLTMAWNGQQDGDRVPIILDIDAYRQAEFEPGDESIWTMLRTLRELKNRCFFGSLKEHAIKEYL